MDGSQKVLGAVGVAAGGGVDDRVAAGPRCAGVRISPLSPELAGEGGDKDGFSMFCH